VIKKKKIKISKRNYAMPGSRHIFWNSRGVFSLTTVNLGESKIYAK